MKEDRDRIKENIESYSDTEEVDFETKVTEVIAVPLERLINSVNPVSKFLKDYSQLFTIMGIFAAVSIYLSTVSTNVGGIDESLKQTGLVIGLALSGLVAAIILLKILDEAFKPPSELSIGERIWFYIFGFLFFILILPIAGVIGSFPDIISAIVFMFLLLSAYVFYLTTIVVGHNRGWLNYIGSILRGSGWSGFLLLNLANTSISAVVILTIGQISPDVLRIPVSSTLRFGGPYFFQAAAFVLSVVYGGFSILGGLLGGVVVVLKAVYYLGKMVVAKFPDEVED